MLLLGIYLISFMVVWYVYLHKLPPIGVYAQQSKSSILYTLTKIVFNIVYTMCINYGFIRFHYVQNKGLCPFSCQNLSNYTIISPLMEKRLLYRKLFRILYTIHRNIYSGIFSVPPPIIQSHKFLLLYYHKFIHIEFLYKGQNINKGTKKSHSYIKAFILQK